MRFVDRVVDNIDALMSYAHKAIWRTNPREFIELASTDDDETFVGHDGSLITLLRVKGLTSNVYDEEMKDAIFELAEVIGRDIIKATGHHLSISYEFDPDSAYQYCKDTLRATANTAQRLGMGDFIDLIVEEKSAKLASLCQSENTYIALYTTPEAIHKMEMKDQIKERAAAMSTWPRTAEAMLMDNAYPQLRVKHRTMVKSFITTLSNLTSLKDVGLMMDVVSVRDYLKVVKQVAMPGTSPKWTPRVAEDFMQDLRVPAKAKRRDFSNADFMMPPTIGQQIFSENPTTIGLKYVVMGNRIHYPLALEMGPSEPETFDRLVHFAAEMRLPFRITFALKGKGTGVDYLNVILAKTFPWMSSANQQVKDAHNALTDYEKKSNGVVPGMYVTACTWAPAHPTYSKKDGVKYDLKEINDRATKLNRALQSWGGCHTTDAFAAPLEAVLSTQAGVYDKPLGTVMAPPMPDAIGLTPLFRPTTSWTQKDGNVLLRTKDGRLLHYQQTSSRQNAWVTLLVGPMGFGKSTALNTLNLYYLLAPSQETELPFLRCLDIGPSSRSIVDLVQASVGPDQQNIAKYIRIQNSKDYQFNPFDTPIGCEFPLPNHQNYLVNLISTICYSLQTDKNVAGRLPGMVTAIVRETYKAFASTDQGGTRPRPYYRRANQLIDDKIHEHGIEVDERTNWHEVRDALWSKGEVRAAYIAHRKAMPVLSDLIGVASSESLRSDYPDEIGGTPVLDLFNRSVREAVEMFPMLQGETKFEIGESRVISLDMEDLVPREATERAMWQASIAFFVGYDILTRDFFFHEDHLKYVPSRYLAYHTKRAKEVKTARKRFSMDERQRFAKVPTAQAQVDGLIAEGRKNLVDIMVASQLFEHHTEPSIRLSTSVIILGSGNMDKEEANTVSTRFGFSPAQMDAIRRIRPPSSKGAEAFMVFRTRDGAQAHHVYMTDGPMYLWLIATEAVDRQFRALMYERHPVQEALKRMAKKYPGGSIKKDLENKLAEMNDDPTQDEGMMEGLLEKMADEC
ncbi:MAG: intracellular multiplication protein IcmB [Marinobacter sp. T13-3]|nr:MAG: intracellular multiplication protein IcmB [Marinobacter sp. T13-3]